MEVATGAEHNTRLIMARLVLMWTIWDENNAKYNLLKSV